MQELLSVRARLHQGDILTKRTKLQTLWRKDARAKLSGHIGLAVLVERHQLVHTEDIHLHIHLRAVHLVLQQRVQLIHVTVLGDIVFIIVVKRSGGIGHAVHLQNIHCHLPVQKECRHILKRRGLHTRHSRCVGGLLHKHQFSFNLCGLIDLTVHFDALKHEVKLLITISRDTLSELPAHSLFQTQRC